MALLGTLDSNGDAVLKHWDDTITENPALNSIEVWEIYNFTADAHPIHIHEVQFQVVNRERFPRGGPRPPERWEAGFKDTVVAYPGEITRVRAKFDLEGLYVWHCHILEHEDHEMMRPYRIGP
jgi:bilirubin oxidase